MCLLIFNTRTKCFVYTGFSLVGGGLGGGSPHYPKNWLAPHSPPQPPRPLNVLTQKSRFCNFHAVFCHFSQIVPPPVATITHKTITISCLLSNHFISFHVNNVLQKRFLKVTFPKSILQANSQYKQNKKKQMESVSLYDTIY